jgi:hypothetical protein
VVTVAVAVAVFVAVLRVMELPVPSEQLGASPVWLEGPPALREQVRVMLPAYPVVELTVTVEVADAPRPMPLAGPDAPTE